MVSRTAGRGEGHGTAVGTGVAVGWAGEVPPPTLADASIRPQDLVGAIANEAGVAGSLIGAIQVADRYSIVEVPEELADQVIRAIGKTKLRGKKVRVRRDAMK